MRRVHVLVIVAALSWPSGSHAEKFELASLRCREFVQTKREDASAISAWLLGYYADPAEAEVVDMARVKEVVDKISAFCASNPNFAISAVAEGLLSK